MMKKLYLSETVEHNTMKKIAWMVLFGLISISCERKYDKDFCNAVSEEDWSAVERYMGTLASKMRSRNTDANMKGFREWLSDKECVYTAEYADEIVPAIPPMMEISIQFITSKDTVAKTGYLVLYDEGSIEFGQFNE
jgi:hypothetical protein